MTNETQSLNKQYPWHLRMAHPSQRRIIRLLRREPYPRRRQRLPIQLAVLHHGWQLEFRSGSASDTTITQTTRTTSTITVANSTTSSATGTTTMSGNLTTTSRTPTPTQTNSVSVSVSATGSGSGAPSPTGNAGVMIRAGSWGVLGLGGAVMAFLL